MPAFHKWTEIHSQGKSPQSMLVSSPWIDVSVGHLLGWEPYSCVAQIASEWHLSRPSVTVLIYTLSSHRKRDHSTRVLCCANDCTFKQAQFSLICTMGETPAWGSTSCVWAWCLAVDTHVVNVIFILTCIMSRPAHADHKSSETYVYQTLYKTLPWESFCTKSQLRMLLHWI